MLLAMYYIRETDVDDGAVFSFAPGLGACGFTNTSSQYVASVSNATFWGWLYVFLPLLIWITPTHHHSGATSDPNKSVLILICLSLPAY